MHELDITRLIANEAKDECKKRGIFAGEVLLELGALSSYKREPIEFFYEAIKEDFSELKRSKLKISSKKGRAECKSCGEKFEISDFWNLVCPKCKSRDVAVVDGEDVKIIKICEWQKR